MSAPKTWLAIVAAAVVGAALSAACGDSESTGPGGPGPAGPAEEVTVQERLGTDELAALTASDAEFGELVGRLTVSEAGTLQDEGGMVVDWAEGLDGSGALRTAVRACDDSGSCTRALQTTSESGLSWELADGSTTTPAKVGRPVLLKDLVGQDLAGKTKVTTLALTSEPVILDADAVPGVDFETRRFVALNTFGGAYGTRLSSVTQAVSSHGGYDEVVEVQYAREGSVAEALSELDHLDAVIWLSASVRQEVKDGWRESRTVALTTNRGGFGDATMDRNAIEAARGVNVGAGPGLVFLAASNSYSDGSPGQPDQGSVWSRLDYDDRILIGVQGHADVRELLTAATTFFELFFAGTVTVQDALAMANDDLPAGVELVANPSSLTRTWLRRGADVWDDVPFTVTKARLITPITAVSKCGAPGQPKEFVEGAPDAQPFADVTFDGNVFTGRNQIDLDSLQVDINYRGVVTGFEPGDRVLLEVWGDFNEVYQGFRGFGEGAIQEVELDDEDGSLHVRFRGPVHATPYTNNSGQECVMNSPQLQTNVSGLAELTLTP